MKQPTGANPPASSVAGLITKASRQSVDATIHRFEEALKSHGFMLFAQLDHAAAAKSVGLEMSRETVIVFGNPRLGTPAFLKTPTLGIDFPLRAMVWENAEGQVFLSYNSADHIFKTIYARHGARQDDSTIAKVENVLKIIAEKAVN
jgi:uncharacterized protein (DUF302 family)